MNDGAVDGCPDRQRCGPEGKQPAGICVAGAFLCVLLFQGGAGRARAQGDRHRRSVCLYHAVYRDERAGLCVRLRLGRPERYADDELSAGRLQRGAADGGCGHPDRAQAAGAVGGGRRWER